MFYFHLRRHQNTLGGQAPTGPVGGELHSAPPDPLPFIRGRSMGPTEIEESRRRKRDKGEREGPPLPPIYPLAIPRSSAGRWQPYRLRIYDV